VSIRIDIPPNISAQTCHREITFESNQRGGGGGGWVPTAPCRGLCAAGRCCGDKIPMHTHHLATDRLPEPTHSTHNPQALRDAVIQAQKYGKIICIAGVGQSAPTYGTDCRHSRDVVVHNFLYLYPHCPGRSVPRSGGCHIAEPAPLPCDPGDVQV